ncbi:protein jag [bacterium]|nr:protein jag [bacterium]
MKSVEASGKTVEEAIEKALQELGAKREEVEVEILQQPKLGGLIGQAKVRVTLKQRLGEKAKEIIKEIMNGMGIRGEVAVREREELIEVEVAVQEDGAILIGRNGSTLLAIQTLLNAIINKGQEKQKKVKLDINDYMRRREEKLRDLALRAAREVRLTRRPKVLESLNPAERKIIHNTLKDDPYVYTYSEGEEPNRKLIIAPKESKT